MKRKIFGFLITGLCLVLFTSLTREVENHTIAHNGDEENDTLPAEVTYGEEFLLAGQSDLSDADLAKLIDSLSVIPEESATVNGLLFYASIRKKKKAEIEFALDSLFSLDSIPYGLVNELNLLLLHSKEFIASSSIPLLQIKSVKNKFPSEELYSQTWDNAHPFNQNIPLDLFDTLFLLHLNSNAFGYHRPASDQTIRKYGIRVGSPFGWRDGKNHNGVDIELDQWDSIPCAFDGVVRMAKNYSGYGKVVIVRHYNGLETLYAHMARISVKSGQTVKAGQLLGLGGSTGNSTGSHLHFEIRYKNIPLNPANVIDFREGKLLSDTLLMRKMRTSFVCTPVGVHFHTVERGDYPHKIATRYGLTVTQLCEMNNISTRTRLRIGQRLRVSS